MSNAYFMAYLIPSPAGFELNQLRGMDTELQLAALQVLR